MNQQLSQRTLEDLEACASPAAGSRRTTLFSVRVPCSHADSLFTFTVAPPPFSPVPCCYCSRRVFPRFCKFSCQCGFPRRVAASSNNSLFRLSGERICAHLNRFRRHGIGAVQISPQLGGCPVRKIDGARRWGRTEPASHCSRCHYALIRIVAFVSLHWRVN